MIRFPPAAALAAVRVCARGRNNNLLLGRPRFGLTPTPPTTPTTTTTAAADAATTTRTAAAMAAADDRRGAPSSFPAMIPLGRVGASLPIGCGIVCIDYGDRDGRLDLASPRSSSRRFSSSLPNSPVDRTYASALDPERGGGGIGGERGRQRRRRREEEEEDEYRNARRSILAHALPRVHDMGWTDDAVASGTIDAGYPPSYVGRALSSSSTSGAFGNYDLVAFFMDECNASLGERLAAAVAEEEEEEKEEDRTWRTTRRPLSPRLRRRHVRHDVNDMSSQINTTLCLRLSMMVLPYASSRRWHEGMAIGALPQNALDTYYRLDDVADVVL
ncbi:hypothetical protein ACHAW5_002362 [Stephanodiscus triporus]|uniref:Ubiquinone biosynthesis protein n=1 Tax=Stephanodiscus triporus TaxID=2934178 RepID=A0ABD3PU08_9STRA